jgi:hypothetical protein
MTANHESVAELGVQFGNQFGGATGRIGVSGIQPALKGGDGVIDLAGGVMVRPAGQVLHGLRTGDLGSGGGDGWGCGHGSRSQVEIRLTMAPQGKEILPSMAFAEAALT